MPCTWNKDDFLKTSILPNIVYKLNKIPVGTLISHDKLLRNAYEFQRKKNRKKILKIKVEEISLLNMKIYYDAVINKGVKV